MSNDNLINQIISQLGSGVSEQQILSALISSGYSQDSAINLLNSAKMSLNSLQNSNNTNISPQLNLSAQLPPAQPVQNIPPHVSVNQMNPNLPLGQNNVNSVPMDAINTSTSNGSFGTSMVVVGLLVLGVLLSFVSYLGLAFPNLMLGNSEISKYIWAVGIISFVLFVIPAAVLLFLNKNRLSNFMFLMISLLLSIILVFANTGVGAFLAFRSTQTQNQQDNNLARNNDSSQNDREDGDNNPQLSPINTPKKTITPTLTPTRRVTPTNAIPRPTQISDDDVDWQEYLQYLDNNTYRYNNTQYKFSLRILNDFRKIQTDNSDPNNYLDTFSVSDGTSSLSIMYSKKERITDDFSNINSLLNLVENSVKSSDKNLSVNCRIETVKTDYVVCQYITTLPNGKYAYVVQTVIPDQRDFSGVVILSGLFLIDNPNPETGDKLLKDQRFILFLMSVGVYSAYTIEFN